MRRKCGSIAERAYEIADNKLALNAGWDEDLLAAELGALMSDDLEFDVGLTGFSIAEIDTLIDAVAPEDEGDLADEAMPDEAPARVRTGDIWQLGRHRLICGDALDADTIGSLMDLLQLLLLQLLLQLLLPPLTAPVPFTIPSTSIFSSCG